MRNWSALSATRRIDWANGGRAATNPGQLSVISGLAGGAAACARLCAKFCADAGAAAASKTNAAAIKIFSEVPPIASPAPLSATGNLARFWPARYWPCGLFKAAPVAHGNDDALRRRHDPAAVLPLDRFHRPQTRQRRAGHHLIGLAAVDGVYEAIAGFTSLPALHQLRPRGLRFDRGDPRRRARRRQRGNRLRRRNRSGDELGAGVALDALGDFRDLRVRGFVGGLEAGLQRGHFLAELADGFLHRLTLFDGGGIGLRRGGRKAAAIEQRQAMQKSIS